MNNQTDNDSADVMRGAVRAVRGDGPMEAHFALTEVREGKYETPVLLACDAKGAGVAGRCRLGARVGAARGATAYEALARAQMFAASLELAEAAEAARLHLSLPHPEVEPLERADVLRRLRAALAKIPGGEA